MANTLKGFIANLRTEGLARPSRFAVEITLPKGMIDNFSFVYKLQSILLFCDATNLPGLSIATTPNRSFGEVRETPYEKLFDSLPLSFYVDNSLVVKSLFDEWANLIQDIGTRQFSYYNDYITKITISVLDMKSSARYRVELHEAYPKQISPISLDYANREVMKLNVGFVFKYWTTVELVPPNYGLDYKLPRIFGFDPNVISPTYFNDFSGYQQQVANPQSSLFGDPRGVFTGTGGSLV